MFLIRSRINVFDRFCTSKIVDIIKMVDYQKTFEKLWITENVQSCAKIEILRIKDRFLFPLLNQKESSNN